MESLSHGADYSFSVAFSSVLWQSVQHPHGTRSIGKNPGHGPSFGIQHTAGGEVYNHVVDHPNGHLTISKLPVLIHQLEV